MTAVTTTRGQSRRGRLPLIPNLFQDGYVDSVSGLSNFQHRDYQTSGRWLDEDAAGYVDGLSLYQFVRSDPVLQTDPLGFADHPTTSTQPGEPAGVDFKQVVLGHTSLGKTGGSTYEVKWTNLEKKTGWVIQHLTVSVAVYAAGGFRVAETNNTPVEYWEAWQVIDGVVYKGRKKGDNVSTNVDDGFIQENEPIDTYGTITISGRVRFIAGDDLPKGNWKEPGNEQAHGLPTTDTPPEGWSDSGAQQHDLTVTWHETGDDAVDFSTKVVPDPKR